MVFEAHRLVVVDYELIIQIYRHTDSKSSALVFMFVRLLVVYTRTYGLYCE